MIWAHLRVFGEMYSKNSIIFYNFTDKLNKKFNKNRAIEPASGTATIQLTAIDDFRQSWSFFCSNPYNQYQSWRKEKLSVGAPYQHSLVSPRRTNFICVYTYFLMFDMNSLKSYVRVMSTYCNSIRTSSLLCTREIKYWMEVGLNCYKHLTLQQGA